MELLPLLRSRNQCLENFLDATCAFGGDPSGQGFVDELALLESKREIILKALDLFERKITEVTEALLGNGDSGPVSMSIQSEILRREELILKIVQADAKIMQMISDESERISKEVTNIRKGKELISRFKSQWVPKSGEEVDGQL